MSLFERIKYKRYDLQEKKKFPGDESGAYKQAKDDLEARKGFSKNKSGGLKADEKNPFVKRSVRKTRVDKLGGDIYDQPKFSQKKFDKSLKKFSKGPRTNIVNPFGKGDTPGQQKVKAMDKRAFKITQPRDIKKTKGYKPYAQLSKEIKKLKTDVAQTATGVKQAEVSKKIAKDNKVYNQQRVAKNLKKGTRNISSMNPSEMERAFGTSSTEGAGGASGSFKTKASKNTMPSGKDFITKNRKQAETATTNLRKKVDKIAKNPKLTGSQKAAQSRPVMKDVKTAQNFARGYANPKTAQTAITLPKDIKTVQSAAKGAIKPSSKSVSDIMKQNTIRVGPTGRVKTKGPQLLDDITVKNVPREIRFGKASSKVLAKTPKAIKPIARPALKLLAKAGTPGRIAAAGLGVAAISPAGRKALGQLATGTGLTALFGRGKKEKQLKVGDGLKNVGKVRVTADSKGLKRNQADMAKIKATQKNFIDKYNKGRAFGKIKYNVNKQGTYDVIKPKKK